MLEGKLSDLDLSRLEELCANRAPESRTLEFKATLPDRSDKGKFELSKDVTAFANADGGDIIFGISENDGTAEKIVPIINESPDAAIRRLGQVLDASVEPKVLGLDFGVVEVHGGYALIIRVPASGMGPHRILTSGATRFVRRELGYVRDMSYSEIRSSFNRTINFSSAVRGVRREAVERVICRQTWRPLLPGPCCIFQIIPMATLLEIRSIDILDVYENYSNFMFSGWPSLSRDINIDGVVFYHGSDQESIYSYNQFLETALSRHMHSQEARLRTMPLFQHYHWLNFYERLPDDLLQNCVAWI